MRLTRQDSREGQATRCPRPDWSSGCDSGGNSVLARHCSTSRIRRSAALEASGLTECFETTEAAECRGARAPSGQEGLETPGRKLDSLGLDGNEERAERASEVERIDRPGKGVAPFS